MLSPKIRCRLWTDDANKTPATSKAGTSRVGRPSSTFNKLLAAGDRGGALEAVGKEIPSHIAESHSFVEGTKVILEGLTTLQYNGQVGKFLKNCTTAKTQDSLVALTNGHKRSVPSQNFGGCPDSAVFSSLPKITQEVLYTHVQQTERQTSSG